MPAAPGGINGRSSCSAWTARTASRGCQELDVRVFVASSEAMSLSSEAWRGQLGATDEEGVSDDARRSHRL